MFDRFPRNPKEPDDSPLALLDDDLDLLLGNPLADLNANELAETLAGALANLGPPGGPEEIAIAMMAVQLEALGKAGRSTLWQIVERAEPEHLRLLLVPIVASERDRTRIHRFLYGLIESDDPLRIAAGIAGFQYRRERKVLRRVLGLREHPSPIVRASVVSIHRSLAEWECLPTIVEAANDPAPEVRRASLACVLDLGVVATSTEVRQVLDRVRGRFLKDRAQRLLNGGYENDDELLEVCTEARDYVASLGREVRWRDVEAAEREHGNVDVPIDVYVALAMRDPADPRLLNRVHDLWHSGDHWNQYVAVTVMTVVADRTFDAEILDLRHSDDVLLGPAAYFYKRMQDPAGVLPELLDLLRSGTSDHKLFTLTTLSGMFAAEVDDELCGWLERQAEDEDELVRKFARLALTPEWERRFKGVDFPILGPHWSVPVSL